jgi:transcriptional regulator, lacI family
VPLFRRPGAPTAVLAYNYSMGVEAYGRLAEAGIRVPDEIEIVSCYSYQSRKSWVSTVVVDDYEIGRTAVKNLQKLIESPDRRLQAEIPFSFFSARPPGMPLTYRPRNASEKNSAGA